MYAISKNIITYVILSGIPLALFAQKLPSKQEVSVWLPSDQKIDGRATEWNNTYHAYNHSTDFFYTVANNNDLLYFIIHVEDPAVIDNLTHYGFSIEISSSEKEKSKNPVVVHFPLEEKKMMNLALNRPGLSPDTSAQVIASVMTANNNTLQKRHKYVVVNGIKGLDTLSIYNETGLKTAEAFDNKRNYTLEVAIPFRYIKDLNKNISKLAYHLVITGYQQSKQGQMEAQPPAGGLTPEVLQSIADLEARINKRNPHTDFWGEYTLAKAP